MSRRPAQLISVGYEGRTVDDLVEQLLSQGVSVLVDVRLNPISRKPGLSKTRLAACLNAAGIRYVHHRELGNPKDNRDAFRHGDPRAFARFQKILQGEPAAEAIHHVSELLDDEVVALLCFERDHTQCHRDLVTEAVVQARPATEVVAV